MSQSLSQKKDLNQKDCTEIVHSKKTLSEAKGPNRMSAQKSEQAQYHKPAPRIARSPQKSPLGKRGSQNLSKANKSTKLPPDLHQTQQSEQTKIFPKVHPDSIPLSSQQERIKTSQSKNQNTPSLANPIGPNTNNTASTVNQSRLPVRKDPMNPKPSSLNQQHQQFRVPTQTPPNKSTSSKANNNISNSDPIEATKATAQQTNTSKPPPHYTPQQRLASSSSDLKQHHSSPDDNEDQVLYQKFVRGIYLDNSTKNTNNRRNNIVTKTTSTTANNINNNNNNTSGITNNVTHNPSIISGTTYNDNDNNTIGVQNKINDRQQQQQYIICDDKRINACENDVGQRQRQQSQRQGQINFDLGCSNSSGVDRSNVGKAMLVENGAQTQVQSTVQRQSPRKQTFVSHQQKENTRLSKGGLHYDELNVRMQDQNEKFQAKQANAEEGCRDSLQCTLEQKRVTRNRHGVGSRLNMEEQSQNAQLQNSIQPQYLIQDSLNQGNMNQVIVSPELIPQEQYKVFDDENLNIMGRNGINHIVSGEGNSILFPQERVKPTQVMDQGPRQPNYIHQNSKFSQSGISNRDYQHSIYDNHSFDALFGAAYESDKDEDYSLKEDLIQNTKTYRADNKPFKTAISKAEIADLKSKQKLDPFLFPYECDSYSEDSYLLYDNPNENKYAGTEEMQREPLHPGYDYPYLKRRKLNNDQPMASLANGGGDQYLNNYGKQSNANNGVMSFNNHIGRNTSYQRNTNDAVRSSLHILDGNLTPPQTRAATKRQVQTKSIQVQVTPEKLQNGDDGSNDSKVKGRRNKKRGRKKKDMKKLGEDKNLKDKNAKQLYRMQQDQMVIEYLKGSQLVQNNTFQQNLFLNGNGVMTGGQQQFGQPSFPFPNSILQYQQMQRGRGNNMFSSQLVSQPWHLQASPHYMNLFDSQVTQPRQSDQMGEENYQIGNIKGYKNTNRLNGTSYQNSLGAPALQDTCFDMADYLGMNFGQHNLPQESEENNNQPYYRKTAQGLSSLRTDQKSIQKNSKKSKDFPSSTNYINPYQQELIRNKMRTDFYHFLNPQLKELIQQIEMYIQLLYQVLLHDPNVYQQKDQQHRLAQGSHDKKLGDSGSKETRSRKDGKGKNVKQVTGQDERDWCKKQAYVMLYEFIEKRDQILAELDLPMYDVPWLKLPSQSKAPIQSKISTDNFCTNEGLSYGKQTGNTVKTHPQVSFFQSSLLEFAPFIVSQIQSDKRPDAKGLEIKGKALDIKTIAKELNLKPSELQDVKQLNLEEVYDVLKPLMNQNLLPPFLQPKQALYPMAQETSKSYNATSLENLQQAQENPAQFQSTNNNNRRKFSSLDDNYLILGLHEFGYKNIEHIRHNWLPQKSVNEIKHRYKNLTCQRVQKNIVKEWKQRQATPFSESELFLLAYAVRWFGTKRWAFLAKCFLPMRTGMQVAVEFTAVVEDDMRSLWFGKIMIFCDSLDNHDIFKIASDLQKKADEEKLQSEQQFQAKSSIEEKLAEKALSKSSNQNLSAAAPALTDENEDKINPEIENKANESSEDLPQNEQSVQKQSTTVLDQSGQRIYREERCYTILESLVKRRIQQIDIDNIEEFVTHTSETDLVKVDSDEQIDVKNKLDQERGTYRSSLFGTHLNNESLKQIQSQYFIDEETSQRNNNFGIYQSSFLNDQNLILEKNSLNQRFNGNLNNLAGQNYDRHQPNSQQSVGDFLKTASPQKHTLQSSLQFYNRYQRQY